MKELKKGDIVFDMFAGVGPFSLPAARKGCKVYANDLNPDSYKWLSHNAALNKVTANVSAYNKDGRDFARDVIKPELSNLWAAASKQDNDHFSVHVVMNLPALAVEFLDVFRGLMVGVSSDNVVLPTVHCYSFSKCDASELDVQRTAEHILGHELPDCRTRVVRKVAPSKDMVCISFQLTSDILSDLKKDEPPTKRLKESD